MLQPARSAAPVPAQGSQCPHAPAHRVLTRPSPARQPPFHATRSLAAVGPYSAPPAGLRLTRRGRLVLSVFALALILGLITILWATLAGGARPPAGALTPAPSTRACAASPSCRPDPVGHSPAGRAVRRPADRDHADHADQRDQQHQPPARPAAMGPARLTPAPSPSPPSPAPGQPQPGARRGPWSHLRISVSEPPRPPSPRVGSRRAGDGPTHAGRAAAFLTILRQRRSGLLAPWRRPCRREPCLPRRDTPVGTCVRAQPGPQYLVVTSV
jgi:hypothetical protein